MPPNISMSYSISASASEFILSFPGDAGVGLPLNIYGYSKVVLIAFMQRVAA